MAKVILKNNWNAPGSHLFRKSATRKGPPVDIPDALVPFLPSTAQVVPDDYVTPEPVKGPETLSEAADLLRAAAVSQETVRAKAEDFRQEHRAGVAAKAKEK